MLVVDAIDVYFKGKDGTVQEEESWVGESALGPRYTTHERASSEF